jgi:hypothetical protein
MGYFVGLDLGKSADYTALAVIQTIEHPPIERHIPGTFRVEQVPSPDPPELHVRHLERFPLGTRYPAIVAAVASRLPALPTDWRDPSKPVLVVDKTGVGAPVVDLFEDAGLEPVPITITSGTSPTPDGRGYHVPKRDLVSTLQVILQNGRLKINQDLTAASMLTQELLSFKTKYTDVGNATFEAWREKDHDDLVLAVAMAVWYAEHGYSKSWTEEQIRNAFTRRAGI